VPSSQVNIHMSLDQEWIAYILQAVCYMLTSYDLLENMHMPKVVGSAPRMSVR